MTKVVFRKLDGDVVALFPGETSHGGAMIQSYEHYGQHSDASVDLLTDWERATPDEYAPLLQELTGMGYELEVVD